MIMHLHFGVAAALLMSALVPSAAPASAQSRRSAASTVLSGRLATLPAFVDGVVAQQIATREVAGAVVTVVHRGRVILLRGYGLANVDRNVPVDPARTLFRPGSVSKLFTWVALMQQIERGRVSMDADVNRYLDFTIPPFEGKPIRVRDLFAHTPGMSDVGGISTADPSKLVPYAAWIKTHIPRRVWAPGTEISYSNYGAALAGYLVERVSGEPFADYMERHLFTPLKMTSTTFREDMPPAMEGRRALGYKLIDGRFVAQPTEYYGVIMPAGAASATGSDMSRFIMAMLGDGRLGSARILSPASVRTLHSTSFANAPGLNGMAHGFMVLREANPRLVGHGGNTRDFHSNLILAPEADLGFFISTTGGEESYGARTELTDALVGRLFPQAPTARQADASGPAPRLGSYRINRRNYETPAKPERDLKISALGSGAVTVELEGRKTHWQRIGAGMYEQATGARTGGPYDRLLFYGDTADPRLSFASQPHVTGPDPVSSRQLPPLVA